MNITTITIGRLYNLGNYEHIRYELTAEVAEGQSPAVALIGLEKLLSALNPKRPGNVPSEDETNRDLRRLAEMRAMDTESSERCHGGYKGTREEYLDRCSQSIHEGTVRREEWTARSKKARKLLEDLGGAANWHDAKMEWEEDEF